MNMVMAVDMAGQFAGQRDEAIELATDLGDEVGFRHAPGGERSAQAVLAEAAAIGIGQRGRGGEPELGEVEVQPERQVDFDRTAGGRFCVDAVDQQRGRADGAGGEAVEDAGVAFLGETPRSSALMIRSGAGRRGSGSVPSHAVR